MIPRYNRPEIEKIWSLENKFKIWTEIECLIAERQASLGIIPKKAAKEIRKKAKFNVEEINELEKKTRHDVNAYIDNVSKYIGKQSKYFHHGVTSSDIIDTGFSIQLKQTGEIISKELKILLKNLKSKSLKYLSLLLSIYVSQKMFGHHKDNLTKLHCKFSKNLMRLSPPTGMT